MINECLAAEDQDPKLVTKFEGLSTHPHGRLLNGYVDKNYQAVHSLIGG
jgi:hypothetical protein